MYNAFEYYSFSSTIWLLAQIMLRSDMKVSKIIFDNNENN